MRYQIFGSESSIDYDVIVFVDELKTISENHELVKKFNVELESLFASQSMPPKKVNANLAVLDDGMITTVFKGTFDEVNNSMYHTYSKHPGNYKQHVRDVYDRTGFHTHLKIKRCLRFLLSFYSRIPEWRSGIKEALRGDVHKRIECVSKIDFTKHTEFPGKREKIEDIYKVIAFQLAQTIGLHQGIELYSKEAVLQYEPRYANCINRTEITTEDLRFLNDRLAHLVEIAKAEAPNMFTIFEEVYNSETN